jgi:hypothetical protein
MRWVPPEESVGQVRERKRWVRGPHGSSGQRQRGHAPTCAYALSCLLLAARAGLPRASRQGRCCGEPG